MENGFIDKLYSGKFEKYEVQSSDDDWNKLNSKLGKSNFLKFSFASFNVFYLAAFLSFAGTAGYFGVINVVKSKKIQSLEKKIETLNEKVEKKGESLIITDTANNEKIDNNQDEISKNKSINPIQNIEKQQNPDENKKENISFSPDLSLKKDSVSKKPDSSVINKPPVQKINKIKKTVFVKKDQILITDTVRIKKKVK